MARQIALVRQSMPSLIRPNSAGSAMVDWYDLEDIVARLPSLERQAVVLVYLAGLTQTESATRLQRRPEEIARAMRNALQAIATAIGEVGTPLDTLEVLAGS